MLAQWKLAKIYANGDSVPRDDIKAYDYFSQIVSNYDEDDPNRRDLAIVSSAFDAIGIYNLNGIANSKVRPDPQRALQMFQFAATNFAMQTPNTIWHACISTALASTRTVGRQSGGCFSPPVKDTSKRKLCSAKRSSRDAKVFGRSARGLMRLTLAREGAIDSKKDNWIIDLYDEAVASANDDDRQNALAYLEDHLKRRN